MNVETAKELVEDARREGARKRVEPHSPGYRALRWHGPKFPIARWDKMRPKERWVCLAYFTVPGMSIEEAAALVDEAAAEISDEDFHKVDNRVTEVQEIRDRLEAQQARNESRQAYERAKSEWDAIVRDLRRSGQASQLQPTTRQRRRTRRGVPE